MSKAITTIKGRKNSKWSGMSHEMKMVKKGIERMSRKGTPTRKHWLHKLAGTQ